MKTAFLIQDITTHGGTERTTCCLANEMARNGHEVSIVSVFHEEDACAYPTDANVRMVWLSNEKYDIHTGVLRRLGMVLRQRKAIRNCAAICEANVVISQKLLASVLAYVSGIRKKTVACEHFRFAMYNAPIRWLRSRMYNTFRGLVVLTDADKEKYVKQGVKRVAVIPNMVSVEPQEYEGYASHRIISVGRLDAQKGYDMLLDALALIKTRMDGWKVDIFGDGPDKEKLMEQCERLGLHHVSFCGFTNNIAKEYAQSCFYVMSSRFEGFPMVLLEAAACGLPIVSFDCPEGPAALLKNGGGILVENGNVQALANALMRMMKDTEFRETKRKECADVTAPYQPQNIYNIWNKFLCEGSQEQTKQI